MARKIPTKWQMHVGWIQMWFRLGRIERDCGWNAMSANKSAFMRIQMEIGMLTKKYKQLITTVGLVWRRKRQQKDRRARDAPLVAHSRPLPNIPDIRNHCNRSNFGHWIACNAPNESKINFNVCWLSLEVKWTAEQCSNVLCSMNRWTPPSFVYSSIRCHSVSRSIVWKWCDLTHLRAYARFVLQSHPNNNVIYFSAILNGVFRFVFFFFRCVL